MKAINLSFLILALLCMSCNGSESEQSLYIKASSLDELGHYEEAVVYWTKVINKNDKNIEAYINRAVDYSYLEEYQKAIDDYSRVLNIDRNNSLAFLNRGKNHARLKEYSKALQDYNAAIKAKGSNSLSNLIFITEENKFDVEMVEIIYERGLVYFNLEMFEEAMKDFNFCYSKNFETLNALYFKGYIYLNYGRITEACLSFKEAKILGMFEVDKEIEKYCNVLAP